MKLIFGKWTQHEVRQMQEAIAQMPHYKGIVIIPSQEPPTVVDVPPCRKPWRRWISIQAHKV